MEYTKVNIRIKYVKAGIIMNNDTLKILMHRERTVIEFMYLNLTGSVRIRMTLQMTHHTKILPKESLKKE